MCQQFELSLREIGYDKEIKCFESPQDAIQSLIALQSSDGVKKVADLIFYTYSLIGDFQAENLMKLTRPDQTQELDDKIQLLPQPVIICSDCSELNFSAFVQDLGAQGFLDLPINKEQLKKHCLAHNTLQVNENVDNL